MSNISEKEFLEQLEKHQNIVHKVCHMFAPGEADRRDLFQEITIKLWLGFQSFKGDAALTTWMYRVAINTAITLTKKAALFGNQKIQISEEYAIAEVIDYSEDIKILYKAISKLSKIEKAVILLWLEEKTYNEIAQIVGISEKNVSVKLVRSKKKLAKIIKKIS